MAVYPPPSSIVPIYNPSLFYSSSSEAIDPLLAATFVQKTGSVSSGIQTFTAGFVSSSQSTFALGTVSSPTISFAGDLNTGIYSSGADTVDISTNATNRLQVSTSAITSTLPVVAPLGAVGTPSYTFSGDLNTGIYSSAADTFDIATGGSNRVSISTTAATSTLPVIHPLGAVGTPSITFSGDLNTGIYSSGADIIDFSTNGTQRVSISTTATTSTLPVIHPLGAVATPSITFSGDLNTGIYSSTADNVDIACGAINTVNSNTSATTISTVGATYSPSYAISSEGLVVDVFPDTSTYDSADRRLFQFVDTNGLQWGSFCRNGNGATSGLLYPVVCNLSRGVGATYAIRTGTDNTSFKGTSYEVNCPAIGGTASTTAAHTWRMFSTANTETPTGVFRIMHDGDAENTNNSYGAISDVRFKENIVDASNDTILDDFKRIHFVNYNLKGKNQKMLGVISDELKDIFPSIVTERKYTASELIEDGGDEVIEANAVKYSILYLKACVAIQELIKKVEELERLVK